MAMFTTIAAGVGMAATAATTAASFAQESKQKRMAAQARSASAQASAEAKKRLEVTFADKLSIQKDPFKMAMESINSAASQAIEASKESERGVAATAGRVVMAVGDNTRNVAGQMSQEMAKLDVLSAQEKAANRNTAVGINIAEATGANKEALNRDQMANQAATQAWTGVGNTVAQGLKLIPLFPANQAATKAVEKLGGGVTAANYLKSLGVYKGVDFSKATSENVLDLLGGMKKSDLSGIVNQAFSFNPYSPDL